jgi:hypothetical protein
LLDERHDPGVHCPEAFHQAPFRYATDVFNFDETRDSQPCVTRGNFHVRREAFLDAGNGRDNHKFGRTTVEPVRGDDQDGAAPSLFVPFDGIKVSEPNLAP